MEKRQKRSRALDWSKELSVVTSVLMCIMFPLNFVIDEIESADGSLVLITLPLTILHFVLMFKNGNNNIVYNNYQGNNTSKTSSEIPNQKNNLEIIILKFHSIFTCIRIFIDAC